MSAVRAATTLALWAAARLRGQSADQVLSAIEATGHRAGVRAATADVAELSGLPGPGSSTAGSMALLPLMQRGGLPELILPHAGDLRGLPPGGDITVPALDAGAVVVFPLLEVGVVPADGHWRAFRCLGGHRAPDLAPAHEMIDLCLANATRDLVRLDISRGSDRVRDRVRDVMLAEAVDCPPGTPGRASALLAKAISLQALLEVATGHETAAVTSRELAVVDDALRPLSLAIREGRRAAVGNAVQAIAAAENSWSGR